MRYGIIAVLGLLTGCESMPRGEIYWQGAHAIDVMQTLSIADDPCYREEDRITKRIIGEQPSREKVLYWGVGKAVGHYWTSRFLDQHAPGWVQPVFQVLTTGHLAVTINRNYDLGIQPWGDNDHSKTPDGYPCNNPQYQAPEYDPFLGDPVR